MPRTRRSESRSSVGRRRAAFTLVEAAVSVLIVGMILVSALGVLGTTTRMRHLKATGDRGYELAEDLMMEILAARFEEPDDTPVFGRETSESAGDRIDWDDVDDYDTWSASPPEDRSGVALPRSTGWTRSVVVTLVSPGPIADLPPGPGLLKRIEVTVRDPGGATTTLETLRASNGANEQPPNEDTTYVTRVGASLLASPGGTAESGATALINHAVGGP